MLLPATQQSVIDDVKKITGWTEDKAAEFAKGYDYDRNRCNEAIEKHLECT